MQSGSMDWHWVAVRYTGEMAKNARGLANEGIGYFILDEGKQGASGWVLVAFRRAKDGPLPDHVMEIVDHYRIKKLNERWASRHGMRDLPQKQSPKQTTIKSARDVLQKSSNSNR